MPCADFDFSEDGSLLAIAFESTLTLWNPDTNGLRLTLESGSNGKIRYSETNSALPQFHFVEMNIWHFLFISM